MVLAFRELLVVLVRPRFGCGPHSNTVRACVTSS